LSPPNATSLQGNLSDNLFISFVPVVTSLTLLFTELADLA
jgi:hypothetical protein